MLPIVLSLGAVYAYIPIIIIIILIAAAAGLSRGWSIFTLFGFAAISNFGRSGTGGVGKGFSRGGPAGKYAVGQARTSRVRAKVPTGVKGGRGAATANIGRSLRTVGSRIKQGYKAIQTRQVRTRELTRIERSRRASGSQPGSLTQKPSSKGISVRQAVKAQYKAENLPKKEKSFSDKMNKANNWTKPLLYASQKTKMSRGSKGDRLEAQKQYETYMKSSGPGHKATKTVRDLNPNWNNMTTRQKMSAMWAIPGKNLKEKAAYSRTALKQIYIGGYKINPETGKLTYVKGVFGGQGDLTKQGRTATRLENKEKVLAENTKRLEAGKAKNAKWKNKVEENLAKLEEKRTFARNEYNAQVLTSKSASKLEKEMNATQKKWEEANAKSELYKGNKNLLGMLQQQKLERQAEKLAAEKTKIDNAKVPGGLSTRDAAEAAKTDSAGRKYTKGTGNAGGSGSNSGSDGTCREQAGRSKRQGDSKSKSSEGTATAGRGSKTGNLCSECGKRTGKTGRPVMERKVRKGMECRKIDRGAEGSTGKACARAGGAGRENCKETRRASKTNSRGRTPGRMTAQAQAQREAAEKAGKAEADAAQKAKQRREYAQTLNQEATKKTDEASTAGALTRRAKEAQAKDAREAAEKAQKEADAAKAAAERASDATRKAQETARISQTAAQAWAGYADANAKATAAKGQADEADKALTAQSLLAAAKAAEEYAKTHTATQAATAKAGEAAKASKNAEDEAERQRKLKTKTEEQINEMVKKAQDAKTATELEARKAADAEHAAEVGMKKISEAQEAQKLVKKKIEDEANAAP